MSGPPSSGILLLDKDAGITSSKAILTLKRKLKLDKIGHSGTLDPFATGLLICLTGKATRLASYAQKGMKVYSGVIQFGLGTDSDDISGAEIQRGRLPEFSEIEEAARNFLGVINQLPPNISAVKVAGVRAYKLARSGTTPTLTPREVRIQRFELTPMAAGEVHFIIECSSGTYIRAIARDLGAALQTCACLSVLRRESSMPFSVNEAGTLETLTADHIGSWTRLFPDLTTIEIDPLESTLLSCGNPRVLPQIADRIAASGVTPEAMVILRDLESQEPRCLMRYTVQGCQMMVNMC